MYFNIHYNASQNLEATLESKNRSVDKEAAIYKQKKYYSNKIFQITASWVKLEGILLNKMSQKNRGIYKIISHMYAISILLNKNHCKGL